MIQSVSFNQKDHKISRNWSKTIFRISKRLIILTWIFC